MRYLSLFSLLVVGCKFDASGIDTQTRDASVIDVNMSTVDTSVPIDGTTPVIDGSTPIDGSLPIDGATPDGPPVCTPQALRCGAGGLETCRPDGSGFTTTPCAYGCNTTPTPHCNQFHPQAPLTLTDLNGTGLTPNIVVPVGTTFNTVNGTITYGPFGNVTVLRAANANNDVREIVSGIAFHQVANGAGARLAVWSFAGVSFPEGTSPTANQTRFVGPNAPVLVSTASMTVNGELELNCLANVFVSGGVLTSAGAGGSPGAAALSTMNGGGMGGGRSVGNQAGGGGAGYGAAGGTGGNRSGGGGGPDPGGMGGGMYGGPTTNPLMGGSGGGAGGSGTGSGGGGGGAIQLVALLDVAIGGGAVQRGGVNAGGCGGRLGGNNGGGGGGGSGGAILIESPMVTLGPRATLAANGGGGGGGDSQDNSTGFGVTGQFGPARAAGGGAGNNGGIGGLGGASGTPTGGTGTSGSGGGGGGGGAAGRIRINTRTGAASTDALAVFSPAASDNLTTQGMIDVH